MQWLWGRSVNDDVKSNCYKDITLNVTSWLFYSTTYWTRMHFSRMRTARSLIVSPHLIVSHACPPPPQEQPCMAPGSNHAPPEQPRIPPRSNHACPLEQPCMPPRSNHACPPREQPCMSPGATTHAPTWEQPHTPPGATMHPPSNHTCPPLGATTHAPPGATTHTPHTPVNRMTNRCKNITLLQTSFAGGNKVKDVTSLIP